MRKIIVEPHGERQRGGREREREKEREREREKVITFLQVVFPEVHQK
jgi:hypothetical protein